MVRNHTMATVILLRVLATHTLVLATSTKHSLVVQVYAMELDRAITATTLLALVTRIVEPAISTESTSVIMTTAMELRRPTIIAIMIMTTTTTTTITTPVVKVVMCSRGGGSASEVETHKNIDSVLHTKTTFQAHSIFSVSIQK